MRPVVIIPIVVIVVVFGLLVTETIDLRPDSTGVRQYTDLKQHQNQWIADSCSEVLCSNGKSVTEMVDEFIEENKNQFDQNGFNMYGFDEYGFSKRGITEEQGKVIHDAYVICASNANEAKGCAYYSGELCMDSNKSVAYNQCNQRSKQMTEDFNLENDKIRCELGLLSPTWCK
jgi:hypothetical protein